MKRGASKVGMRFGLLTVSAPAPSMHRKTTWQCLCDCGGQKTVTGSCLDAGNVRSCGCLKAQPKSHGHTVNGQPSPTYKSWDSMVGRCTRPELKAYPNYGGRGIRVCDDWMNFEGFLLSMGERPPGMTIERIDVNGNYEPGNCRWATRAEQNRNTRRNRFVVFNGQRMHWSAFAEIVSNIQSPQTAMRRLREGWSPERVATTPSKIRRKCNAPV